MTPTDADSEVLEALAGVLSAELIGSTVLHREATSAGFVTGYLVDLRSAGQTSVQQTVYLEVKPAERERPGVLRFVDEDGDGVVDAWLYPNDPALPALGAAVHPDAASVVLARIGVPIGEPELELVAYRPGKRAVIRATGDGREVFLKVVKPRSVERISTAHAAWRAAGVPVPRSLGWATEGLIALEALGGVSADVAIPDRRAQDAFLDALLRLTDTIAHVPSTVPARASLFARLDWYGGRLAGSAPEHAGRIREVCDAIRRSFEAAPEPELRTIHGDLHLGQLRVHGEDASTIVGVLDIDTAGRGDPADDLAAFAGHAIATAALHASRDATAASSQWAVLADAWIGRWPEHGGRGARARAITATHLLAHALTGTAPTALLVELAATILDETALMAASFPSHPAPGV